jgi:nucleotide-binding universal stress UspA family protein
MYRNILVPTDGSDAANQGLREAIKLAKALGATIQLFHVMNESAAVPADLPGVDIKELVRQARHQGETILAQARDQVRSEGVEVDTLLLEVWSGQAGHHVVQHAKEWPADLIVCGTHGRSGIRRIVLGSDAEFIVRRSPVPVLLVRAQAAQELE